MTSFPNTSKFSVVLAPMEGVTDSPMRELLSSLGGLSYCVSEFIRISQDVPKPSAFPRLIPELHTSAKTKHGTPVQIQLLGGHPERLAQAAVNAVSAGAVAIDINFGCPAPLVNNHDGGASILKCPSRIFDITSTVRQTVPKHIPVSVKMRLGWDDEKTVFESVEYASKAKADWITIHARTRLQGYKPPAHWKYIGEARKQTNVPIIANGDIWTFEDFLRCQEQTQCSHFMIGRSAVANPSLARKMHDHLSGNGAQTNPSLDWIALIEQFKLLCWDYSRNQNYALARIKQWVGMASHAGQLLWAKDLRSINNLPEFLIAFEKRALENPTF